MQGVLRLQEPFRAVFYAPFYAALARDAFARQGLAIELTTVGDAGQAAANLVAGTADLAWGGPMRVIRSHAQGDDHLACFGAVVMRDPFLLLGRGPAPARFSLRDLARLRLGVVSEVPTPWWCLQDDLRRLGLDPAALPLVTGHSMAQNAAALLAGEIDLMQTFEPFVATLEGQGVAVWHAQAARGPTSYTSFYATCAALVGRREAFRGVVRAIAETSAWVAVTPSEQIAALVGPGFFPDLEQALLATGIARYQRLGIWPDEPRFTQPAFDRLQGAMLGAGVVTRAPGFAACVDAAIEAEALAG